MEIEFRKGLLLKGGAGYLAVLCVTRFCIHPQGLVDVDSALWMLFTMWTGYAVNSIAMNSYDYPEAVQNAWGTIWILTLLTGVGMQLTLFSQLVSPLVVPGHWGALGVFVEACLSFCITYCLVCELGALGAWFRRARKTAKSK